MDKDTTVVDFRTCFGSDVGKRVLANMLLEANFFAHEHTPEEQAVSNFMKTVLCKCGVYYPDNADDFVERILGMKVYGYED